MALSSYVVVAGTKGRCGLGVHTIDWVIVGRSRLSLTLIAPTGARHEMIEHHYQNNCFDEYWQLKFCKLC
jgi:hypothetical protein